MNTVFDSIMVGLQEAIDDTKKENPKLQRRTVTIVPVKCYSAEQIKSIRKSVNMSQSSFAGYLGISEKTVEAWEAGLNHPSGAASRLLNMLEMDRDLVNKYPFVVAKVSTN